MIHQKLFDFNIEPTDERLTSKAGLIFIAEYIKALGLKELIDREIPKPKSNRAYNPSTFVITILILLLSGGKSIDDIRDLKCEKALFDMLGISVIPDPTSVGDFLRRNSKYLDRFDSILDMISKNFLSFVNQKEFILDIDATEVIADKKDAKYTYKKENKGYMPMLGTLDNKFCIKDEFREGNVPPAFGHKDFYGKIKKAVPEGKRIGYLRADSASYNYILFNELEKDGVYFAVTARQDASVRKAIETAENWTKYENFEVAETVHSMDKTKKAFRLVIKKELRQGELFEEDTVFYHIIATNIPEEKMDALSVLNFHNKRGDSENINKEVKLGFGLEKMPCGDFSANALFFKLGILAYNIFICFKNDIMPSFIKCTVSTLRWKIINIAGKIVSHAGKNTIRIPYEKLESFRNIRDNIIKQANRLCLI